MKKLLLVLMSSILMVSSLKFNSIEVYAAAPQLNPSDFTEVDLWKVIEGGRNDLDVLQPQMETLLQSEFTTMMLAEGFYVVDEYIGEYYQKAREESLKQMKSGSYLGSDKVYLYKGQPYAIQSDFWGFKTTLIDNDTYQGYLKTNNAIDIDGNLKNVNEAFKTAYGFLYGVGSDISELLNDDKNWYLEKLNTNYLSDFINMHLGLNGYMSEDLSLQSDDECGRYKIIYTDGYSFSYDSGVLKYSELSENWEDCIYTLETDYENGKLWLEHISKKSDGSFVGGTVFSVSSRSRIVDFQINFVKPVHRIGGPYNWNEVFEIVKGLLNGSRNDLIKNHIFIKPNVDPSIIGGNRYNLGDIKGTNLGVQADVAQGVESGVDYEMQPDLLPEYQPIPIEYPLPSPETEPDKMPKPDNPPDDDPSNPPDDDPSNPPDDDPSNPPDDDPSNPPDDDPSNPPEEQPDASLDDWHLHDLRGLFPFCIPFDLYDCFKLLLADPIEPKWTVPIQIGYQGKYIVNTTITIDLTQYNLPTVFKIFRTFEVLGFCILLGVVTKKFIY